MSGRVQPRPLRYRGHWNRRGRQERRQPPPPGWFLVSPHSKPFRPGDLAALDDRGRVFKAGGKR